MRKILREKRNVRNSSRLCPNQLSASGADTWVACVVVNIPRHDIRAGHFEHVGLRYEAEKLQLPTWVRAPTNGWQVFST